MKRFVKLFFARLHAISRKMAAETQFVVFAMPSAFSNLSLGFISSACVGHRPALIKLREIELFIYLYICAGRKDKAPITMTTKMM